MRILLLINGRVQKDGLVGEAQYLFRCVDPLFQNIITDNLDGEIPTYSVTSAGENSG